ncbi:hypothetical protein [Sporisorium scitamineum]|uniref:Uncharacterized protein n=1 Tax=Sporisorium scitamineum TaxID=49012 RepID=A0A0F7S289_9BASI|nr:hypothetical protein [Sporisorium scitamineum]
MEQQDGQEEGERTQHATCTQGRFVVILSATLSDRNAATANHPAPRHTIADPPRSRFRSAACGINIVAFYTSPVFAQVTLATALPHALKP